MSYLKKNVRHTKNIFIFVPWKQDVNSCFLNIVS